MERSQRIAVSTIVAAATAALGSYSVALAVGLGCGLVVFGVGEMLEAERRKLRSAASEDARQLEAMMSLLSAMRPRLALPSMRNWAISPDFGAILYAEIVTRRPRLVVELGGGVSSLIIAYALEAVGENGRLVSIDHDANYSAETKTRLQQHGLEQYCEQRVAPLEPITLDGSPVRYYARDALDAVGGIDLLVVDGPPQAHEPQPLMRYPALPLLRSQLAPGALVLIDDAARGDETEMVKRWKSRWPEFTARYLYTEKGTVLLESA